MLPASKPNIPTPSESDVETTVRPVVRLATVNEVFTYPRGVKRPATRAECVDGERPCPWAACKFHLALDVTDSSGRIAEYHPGRDIAELTETCALDIADVHEGEGITLDAIAQILGITRESVRQVEEKALRKLRRRYPDLLERLGARGREASGLASIMSEGGGAEVSATDTDSATGERGVPLDPDALALEQAWRAYQRAGRDGDAARAIGVPPEYPASIGLRHAPESRRHLEGDVVCGVLIPGTEHAWAPSGFARDVELVAVPEEGEGAWGFTYEVRLARASATQDHVVGIEIAADDPGTAPVPAPVEDVVAPVRAEERTMLKESEATVVEVDVPVERRSDVDKRFVGRPPWVAKAYAVIAAMCEAGGGAASIEDVREALSWSPGTAGTNISLFRTWSLLAPSLRDGKVRLAGVTTPKARRSALVKIDAPASLGARAVAKAFGPAKAAKAPPARESTAAWIGRLNEDITKSAPARQAPRAIALTHKALAEPKPRAVVTALVETIEARMQREADEAIAEVAALDAEIAAAVARRDEVSRKASKLQAALAAMSEP